MKTTYTFSGLFLPAGVLTAPALPVVVPADLRSARIRIESVQALQIWGIERSLDGGLTWDWLVQQMGQQHELKLSKKQLVPGLIVRLAAQASVDVLNWSGIAVTTS